MNSLNRQTINKINSYLNILNEAKDISSPLKTLLRNFTDIDILSKLGYTTPITEWSEDDEQWDDLFRETAKGPLKLDVNASSDDSQYILQVTNWKDKTSNAVLNGYIKIKDYDSLNKSNVDGTRLRFFKTNSFNLTKDNVEIVKDKDDASHFYGDDLKDFVLRVKNSLKNNSSDYLTDKSSRLEKLTLSKAERSISEVTNSFVIKLYTYIRLKNTWLDENVTEAELNSVYVDYVANVWDRPLIKAIKTLNGLTAVKLYDYIELLHDSDRIDGIKVDLNGNTPNIIGEMVLKKLISVTSVKNASSSFIVSLLLSGGYAKNDIDESLATINQYRNILNNFTSIVSDNYLRFIEGKTTKDKAIAFAKNIIARQKNTNFNQNPLLTINADITDANSGYLIKAIKNEDVYLYQVNSWNEIKNLLKLFIQEDNDLRDTTENFDLALQVNSNLYPLQENSDSWLVDYKYDDQIKIDKDSRITIVKIVNKKVVADLTPDNFSSMSNSKFKRVSGRFIASEDMIISNIIVTVRVEGNKQKVIDFEYDLDSKNNSNNSKLNNSNTNNQTSKWDPILGSRYLQLISTNNLGNEKQNIINYFMNLPESELQNILKYNADGSRIQRFVSLILSKKGLNK